MKGRVEVIRDLLRAKPESIHEKLGKGETVLHLCVKYYRLEALETLSQYLQSCNNMKFLLNSEDDDGNTILHLAVGLKQMEVRGHLITAATLTATMAYQAILTPVGGVWHDSSKPNQAPPPYIDSDPPHVAGFAIMDAFGPYSQVAQYVAINTVVLVASLSTIILALSGFPLHNKFLLWLLIFTIYTTISCLAIAYFMALAFLFDHVPVHIVKGLLISSFGVMGLVVMLHTCHFLVWLRNKFGNRHFLVWLRNKFGNLVTRCRTRGRRGGANHITHEKSCCWQP